MDAFLKECVECNFSLEKLSKDTLNALCRIIAGAVIFLLFIHNQYRVESLNARFVVDSEGKCKLSKLELYALYILRCQSLIEEKKKVNLSFFTLFKTVEELLKFLH